MPGDIAENPESKKVTRLREVKALPQITKAIEGRSVTTLFSVFGNVDSVGDRIWPGAFAKTIRERGNKVLHLWQHDFYSPPIAVVKELREVAREELPSEVLDDYPDASGGVEAVSEFLDNGRAAEVFRALEKGAPLEASFGFDAMRWDYTDEEGASIRNLREIRLWEVSTVLWGANPATLGSKFYLPLDFLTDQLTLSLEATKEGRRNATTDQGRINQIAHLAVELGADNVKLLDVDDPDKGKAATQKASAASAEPEPTIVVPPLTLARERLRLLELSTL